MFNFVLIASLFSLHGVLLTIIETSITKRNEQIVENVCTSYMNSYFEVKNEWKCSYISYSGENESGNKRPLQCSCTFEYPCYEYEEFSLDKELISVKDYMSNEFSNKNSFYTQQCAIGLQMLTNETNWTCVLQYDMFHVDEYYCNCNRRKKCRIDKLLKL